MNQDKNIDKKDAFAQETPADKLEKTGNAAVNGEPAASAVSRQTAPRDAVTSAQTTPAETAAPTQPAPSNATAPMQPAPAVNAAYQTSWATPAPHAGQPAAAPALYGAPPSPAKLARSFTPLESTTALLCFVLGFLFVRTLVWNLFGLGLTSTLTLLGILALSWVFLRLSGRDISAHARNAALLCALFALNLTLTDNETIKLLALCFSLTAGAYFVFAACANRSRIDDYLGFDAANALVWRPFSGFSLCFRAAGGAGKKSGARLGRQILGGLLIAAPLALVVGMLLAAADQGMEQLFEHFFEMLNFNLLFQLALGIPVACYLFGMLYANGHDFHAEMCTKAHYESRLTRRRWLPNLAAYTALVPMLALYAVFFALQAKYFLSAFGGALPEGWGYAEYARRGFFELCALSVINLAAIWVVNRFTVHSGSGATRPLRVFTALLSGFTILIIATALSKMALYIARFGLTRLRLYTSWFMVLLAVVFVLILIKQFARGFGFCRAAATAFILLFTVLCFSMSDNLIARYNIAMYENGSHEELDLSYLLNLSDDAALYTIAYLEGPHSEALEVGYRYTDVWLEQRLEQYEAYPEYCGNLSSLRVLAEARTRRAEAQS